ncbi:MAG TPA: enoyl-CoA hydratase/isomerase family protein [Virgibacillus sp.]|nr:enoyl-CoA hydratase/isomerase family protein [Virgibacillus sp.]
MTKVLFSTNNNGVATITLNRPDVLNSLNYDMLLPIKQKLQAWEKDDQIQVIILQGAGEKAFCAGGDIKTLYDARESKAAMKAAEQFFSTEYETDQLVHDYKKPIVAILDGIVMGGGVGLAYGASHRIVTEQTKWAMPEMNIGFFPDVGAAHFLNKAPGKSGLYLALTASVIPADDVLYIGAADFFCQSHNIPKLVQAIENTNWLNIPVGETLASLLADYNENAPQKGYIAQAQDDINEHFSQQTVEAIIDSLASASSEFASQTKKTILEKSPASVKITLKQLIDGEHQSFKKCLNMDLIIAKNFLRHDDFFEGVRAVLIDKDRNPQYKYKTLADVSNELVASFFKDPS